MIKIEPENLIKLIQKQLDKYPEPDIYRFYLCNFRGNIQDICSKLNFSKNITHGPELIKLTSNVNHDHVYVMLMDENKIDDDLKKFLYQVDYSKIDICKKMSDL